MSMRKRKKVQILSREELRLRRWDFRLVPSERGLEAVGKSLHLHIISRDNHIDLFPHTSAVEKMAILRSKKPLINSRKRTRIWLHIRHQSGAIEPCGDGLLAQQKSLILCGFTGIFWKYVTVFLFDKNVSKNVGG